jgi:hypothetical protein
LKQVWRFAPKPDPERWSAIRIDKSEVRADHERQIQWLAFDVRPHNARERTFIGDRQTHIAQLSGPRDALFAARRTVQKREVGKNEQLRIRGYSSCSNSSQIKAWTVRCVMKRDFIRISSTGVANLIAPPQERQRAEPENRCEGGPAARFATR